jgi:putative PIN family toxin of toxin-antitoxin system
VTAAECEEFLEAFVERATFVEPTEEIRVCRDAKDDKFLELAASGGTAYLITEDNDLRSLNPYPRYRYSYGS